LRFKNETLESRSTSHDDRDFKKKFESRIHVLNVVGFHETVLTEPPPLSQGENEWQSISRA